MKYYIPMRIFNKWKLNTGSYIPLKPAEGAVGVLVVFKNKKKAKQFYPGAKILEVTRVEDSCK